MVGSRTLEACHIDRSGRHRLFESCIHATAFELNSIKSIRVKYDQIRSTGRGGDRGACTNVPPVRIRRITEWWAQVGARLMKYAHPA